MQELGSRVCLSAVVFGQMNVEVPISPLQQNSEVGFWSRVPTWLALLACLGCAAAAYGATAHAARFLNFDDNLFFGPDNPLFASAVEVARTDGFWAGLLETVRPGRVVADVYLPVNTGSLFFDYWWFDGQPQGPHVVSLLLHALVAFCTFGWLGAMRVDRRIALGVACCFALHPALAESVAWVSSRKDVLSGLFVAIALWQTARLADAGRAGGIRLVVIGLCGVLAMYSKATAVVQPLLALLVCLFLGGAPRRFYAPIVLAVVTVPIALHHQVIAAAAGTLAGGDIGDRLPQVPGAFAHYLGVAFWPRGLNVLYPEVQTLDAFRQRWLAGVLLLATAAVAILALWRRPQWRASALGLLGFVLAMVPFNTAYPASVIAAADRYLYLAIPFAGLSLLGLLQLAPGGLRWSWLPVAFVLVLVTSQRAWDFRDSEALWRSSLAVTQDNAVAQLNLVHALQPAVRDAAGASEVRTLVDGAIASARYPEHALRARLLRADLALQDNMVQLAAEHAAAAIEAAEQLSSTGRLSAAVARQRLVETLLVAITPLRMGGRQDEAQAALLCAQELAPDSAGVVAAGIVLEVERLAEVMGRRVLSPEDPKVQELARRIDAARDAVDALQRQRLRAASRQDLAERDARFRDAQLEAAAGTFERLRQNPLAALTCFRRTIDAAPALVDGWLGATQVCLDAQMFEQAEEYARGGLVATAAGGGRDPRLLHSRAQALAGMGRLSEAVSALKSYVRSQPRDRDAARLLSSLLMAQAIARMSDPKVVGAELQALIDEAETYNPIEPRADFVRARLARDRGDFAAAVVSLDRLLAVMPDFPDARDLLVDNLRDLGYEALLKQRDDAGAARAWRRLLELEPEHVSAQAIGMQLKAIWRRAEARGVEAADAGDREAAVNAFRLCLEVDPEHHWPAYLLAQQLFADPAADGGELDRLTRQALEGQRAEGLDDSRPLLLRALVLQRIGERQQARELLAVALAEPREDADKAVQAALRRLLAELGG